MKIHRSAVIVSFRSVRDLNVPAELVRLKCRLTTFKGVFLGVLDTDGYDVAAAFNNEEDAQRFLDRYLENGSGPISQHVIGVSMEITI